NDQFGWLDNVRYYLGDAIPAVSWIVPTLAVVGLSIACMRRDTRRLLLAGFFALFVAVISLSSLHLQRWIIPGLPLVVPFAANAVVTAARAVTTRLASPRMRRWVFVAMLVLGTVAVAAEPASSLVDYERQQDAPSTRMLMRDWIINHVPK